MAWSMKTTLPRCNFLDANGKRCRVHSALELEFHGDGEIYNSAWVKVNLCPEHYVFLGGSFKPKQNEKRNKTTSN